MLCYRKIIFEAYGEGQKQRVEFEVPFALVEPELGIFFAGKGTRNEANIKANFPTGFNKFYKGCKLLKGEEGASTEGEISAAQVFLTECMSEEQIDNTFGKSKSKIDNVFSICPTKYFQGDAPKYTARIIRECIIVPGTLKEPFEIKCYPDSEKDKREKNAFMLHVKVMKYNEEKKDVQNDADLANNLNFTIVADTRSRSLAIEKAVEAVENAEIIAELEPKTGAATDKKNYATYRIYPKKSVEADSEAIDLIVNISCDDGNIEEISLKAQLKPQVNYKAMIKWFLERPKGTYIDNFVKLGDVGKYWSAIDFISNKVIEHSKAHDPRTSENHYEDGKLDPMRPRSVVLRKESMPTQIGEFTKIQSLYHELSHAIEDQNGDITFIGGFGNNPGAERHSYFLQYLSDAVKVLTDIERNFPANLEGQIREAITCYKRVFFNSNNLQPIDYFAEFDWFGAKTPTQHQIFDKYSMLDVLYDGSALSPEQTERIARCVQKHYFPGNIFGEFIETDGFFKGATWRFTWDGGELMNVVFNFPGFKFNETSRRWHGGSKLAMTIHYDVKTDDGRIDSLIAVLDAGTYDPFDYNYPSVTGFNVTWKPTLKISDCIIGTHIDKTVKAVKK